MSDREDSARPAKRARHSEDQAERVELAFLGPLGTYGHQAAQAFAKHFSTPPDMVPCPSIPAVYAHSAPFLVLPLQNTLQGAVMETLDCLLSVLQRSLSPTPLRYAVPTPASRRISNGSPSANGHSSPGEAEAGPGPGRQANQEAMIIGDLNLSIKHCLVAKRGTRMEAVKWVRSHEQALGQSDAFLTQYLPEAKRQPWPSTAAAALSLLTDDGEDTAYGPIAAICSKAVLTQYPDELEVLWEGTQGVSDNFTRFLLLSRTSASSHILAYSKPSAINGKQGFTNFHVSASAAALNTLAQHNKLLNIHSRPAPYSETSVGRFPMCVLAESYVDIGARMAGGDMGLLAIGRCRLRLGDIP